MIPKIVEMTDREKYIVNNLDYLTDDEKEDAINGFLSEEFMLSHWAKLRKISNGLMLYRISFSRKEGREYSLNFLNDLWKVLNNEEKVIVVSCCWRNVPVEEIQSLWYLLREERRTGLCRLVRASNSLKTSKAFMKIVPFLNKEQKSILLSPKEKKE
jgi:hypothetical protein